MPNLIKLYLHVNVDMLRSSVLPSARRQVPIKRPPVLTEHQQQLWEMLAGKCDGYGRNVDLTVARDECPLETYEEMIYWVSNKLQNSRYRVKRIVRVCVSDEAVTWYLVVRPVRDA